MQSQAIFVIIIPLLVLVPAFIVKIILTRKRAARKPQVIRQMQTAVAQVIPQAKGYTVVLAQAEKDTMSILKEAGEDFTRQFAVAAVGAALGYHAHYRVCPDRLPQFILAYRGDDLYAVCVDRPRFNDIQVDKDCMLHLTRQTVEKVKIGAAGLMTFFLKGGTKFIVTIPTAGIAEISQAAEQKDFKAFCRNFSQVIND